ncbi:conserved Plasmodium protein, unknown function [Plasmodium sp. DRC-Itaito]|nr:conserved Plasmodium protein, unknown function [Plasmodium sp. DRC-Itaito]
MNSFDNNEMNETKSFMMSNKNDDILVDCNEYIDGNSFDKKTNMENIYDENDNVNMKNNHLLIDLNDSFSFTYTNGHVEKEEKKNILHDEIHIDNDQNKYKYCCDYNLHTNEEEHQEEGSPNNNYEQLDNNFEKQYFYYNSDSKHCMDEKNETNDLENENVVTSMDVSYENVLNDNFIKSRSTSINLTDNSFVLNKENLKSSHHINDYYINDFDNIKSDKKNDNDNMKSDNINNDDNINSDNINNDDNIKSGDINHDETINNDNIINDDSIKSDNINNDDNIINDDSIKSDNINHDNNINNDDSIKSDNINNDDNINSDNIKSDNINNDDNINSDNIKSNNINNDDNINYDHVNYNDDNKSNSIVSNKDNSEDNDPTTYERNKKDIINSNFYEDNKNNMNNIINNDKENIHIVDIAKNEENNINNNNNNNDDDDDDAINKVNNLNYIDTENYKINEQNTLPLNTNDDIIKLLDEINDLKNTIENMKKEKINLLSKFKAYTLNNKKELEELKIECKYKEEQIKMYENKLQNKEEEIMNYVNELQNKEDDIMNYLNKLQNKQDQIETYQIQLDNKEQQIETYQIQLHNKEEEIMKYVNELQNNDFQKEKKELKEINEVLKNTNEKLEKEIRSLLGEMKKIEEENKVLKIFKEEKNKTNNKNINENNNNNNNNNVNFKQMLLDNKSFNKLIVDELNVEEENILFCFSIDKEKKKILVCIKQNDDNFFLIPNCIFDEKFPGLKKKTENMIIQDIHEKEIIKVKNEHMNELYLLKKEKEDIYHDYEEYKKKVNSLINETNYNYKNIEEKENEIKELNNTLNKYKEEINNYKEEIIHINEKYKLLEIELCKEKNIRDQQNVGISDLKKKMIKEKIELEKKYKEQYDKETQQKINDIKIIFHNKEKILQDKIEDLLHKIEKLTFSNDDKTKTIENLQIYIENDDNMDDHMINEKQKKINDHIDTDDKVLLNYVPDNHINTDHNHNNNNVDNVYLEKKNKNNLDLSKKETNNLLHTNEQENDNNNNYNNNNNINVEKIKSINSNNTSIPIYPNEYKKIRKKLETYEILLNEEQEGKKKMIEEINSLKNQVKNYESINGNYQHIIYQKNILSNFIAQIPARIQVDDYVSVIFNSFNFSNQEIEAINIKRSKK